MFYREIITVDSEIHTKRTYTLCEQNVKFLLLNPEQRSSLKPGGTLASTKIHRPEIFQVTSGLGLRKFQADGFLLTRVYIQ